MHGKMERLNQVNMDLSRLWVGLLVIALLTGCGCRAKHQDLELTSIQLVDRNGFNETVTAPDRLDLYANNSFLDSQPYEKVTRLYRRNAEGKVPSCMTAYHPNGQISLYLEAVDGCALGPYKEWYPNGNLRVEAYLIGGVGELTPDAQTSWIFDGLSQAWDEQGDLLAQIYYERGQLQGNAFYYGSGGVLREVVPYERGQIEGEVQTYAPDGSVLGVCRYHLGCRDGASFFQGDADQPPLREEYLAGRLQSGLYYNHQGDLIFQIESGEGRKPFFAGGDLVRIESFVEGRPEGRVECFQEGVLTSRFEQKDGCKEGEELVYHRTQVGPNEDPQVQLSLEWRRGVLQGTCRSFYPSGRLESERQMSENCLHGICSAWYPDGSLRLTEEYRRGRLVNGSYLQKVSGEVSSNVEDGEGIATLYSDEGMLLREVIYREGEPVIVGAD